MDSYYNVRRRTNATVSSTARSGEGSVQTGILLGLILTAFLIILSVLVVSRCADKKKADPDEDEKEVIPNEDYYETTTAMSHDESGCQQTEPAETQRVVDRNNSMSHSSDVDQSRHSTAMDSLFSEGGFVCPICLGSFKKTQQVVWSAECRHVYHQTCLDSWMEKRKDCPFCRFPLKCQRGSSRATTESDQLISFCVEHGFVHRDDAEGH